MNRTFILAGTLTLCAGAANALDGPGGHFIESWDLDGDGAVTLEELATRRGDVFYTFDTNRDDRLDAEEYAQFDQARANDMADNAGHAGGSLRRASQGMTLAFNDENGNGAVEREEFLSRSQAWLALIDRDASGAITTADFGRN